MKDTTIAAIATYPAESALAIIRVSGKDAFCIAASVFTAGKKSFKSIKPNRLTLGCVFSGKEKIDEVMLALFKAPHSYTGEDMAEITCHGNPFVLDKIMSLLISKGCVPAGPGEFTKRAFLNGKMDLSRAEAVADVISAKNDTALKIALNQLSGGESGLIKQLRLQILSLLSLVEAEIDFAHEDIHRTTPQQAAAIAGKAIAEIDHLINNADAGIMLKNGIQTVICGKPNTGKSSLLNALLNRNRAIVTNTAGTTRDTVEGSLYVNGLHFKLIDTAGLRQAKNQAEKHGIKKTETAMKTSDIIVFIVDGSKKTDAADLAVFRRLKTKKLIVAVNKSDLKNIVTADKAAKFFRLSAGTPVIAVSAKTKKGINVLTKTLKDTIITEKNTGSAAALITSLRHKTELEASKHALQDAVKALHENSFEEASVDIKQAAENLGSITGEISSEDVLERIFKNFCIGK